MSKTLKVYVPFYGSYYHFMTESVLGLYSLLLEQSKLESLDCQIWYPGNFAAIVQLFSRFPITIIPRIIPDLADANRLGPDIETLNHIRLENRAMFQRLASLAEYLSQRIPVTEAIQGITIIRRSGIREYQQTDELVLELSDLSLPVRVVHLEIIPFADQVNLMRNTLILIAPHGAGTINQVFLPKGGKIIELFPKGYSNWHASAVAEVFGHKLVEIESDEPGPYGRLPSEQVKKFIKENGWPDRNIVQASRTAWRSEELLRVVRDVKSFSIEPKKIRMEVIRQITDATK